MHRHVQGTQMGQHAGVGGRAEWDESLEESVVGGVLFLPGRQGQEAPGLGVAGWTPVTEFLWLLKLRKDCRG